MGRRDAIGERAATRSTTSPAPACSDRATCNGGFGVYLTDIAPRADNRRRLSLLFGRGRFNAERLEAYVRIARDKADAEQQSLAGLGRSGRPQRLEQRAHRALRARSGRAPPSIRAAVKH